MAKKTAKTPKRQKNENKQIKKPVKVETPTPVNVGRDKDKVVIVEKMSVKEINVKKAPQKHPNRVKIIHR